MEDSQVHRTDNDARSSCKKVSQLTKMACLLVLLLGLPQSIAGNSNRFRYTGGQSYTGRNCTSPWCGEVWRANRILYYNYKEDNAIVLANKTIVHKFSDCYRTGDNSTHCITVTETITREQKVDQFILVKSNESVEVRDSPELDNGLLLSDNNVENGQEIEDTYKMKQDKIWQLKLPRGCMMTVTFHKFDIESSAQCRRDYFSVQTSKNPDDVHAFCGNELKSIVIKRRKRVQFKFHSDQSDNVGGIHATVCISNLDPRDDDVNQPCTCKSPVGRRRRRRRSPVSFEEQRAEEHRPELRQQQDNGVDEWLRTTIKETKPAVEKLTKSPLSRLLKHRRSLHRNLHQNSS